MVSEKAYFINSFYVRLLGLNEGLVSPDKPRVVFLHGLLGNGQNWIPTARALEKKFTILMMDQRGHGKTTEVAGSFQPKDFSDDLYSVIQNLNWSKFSLVGHSLGARVAFDFAARHPEVLDKVVFEDMGPHKTGSASRTTEVMIEAVPVPFSERAEARDFFKNEFEPKYGKTLSDYLYGNIEKKGDGSYNWRFDKAGALECLEVGRNFDFWEDFESVKAPNLIIRGEKSEHLPLDVYNEMLKRNSTSEGVQISGAGHWVHFDRFGAFVKQVDEFLSK